MAKQTAVFQDREDTHSNHFSFGFFQVQMGRSHFFFARVEHVIKICGLILSKVFSKAKQSKFFKIKKGKQTFLLDIPYNII